MKTMSMMLLVLLSLAVVGSAEESMPPMPQPAKEHTWLQQLVGEWDTVATMTGPDGKTIECKGTESARSIGGFWVLAEVKGDMMGMPMTGIMTLGFDPEKKKYVGTWVDSFGSYLWKYEGSVDETGKILTLDTEGPCPMGPGKLSKFKEVLEIKSPDQKVFTSSVQGEDGKWTTMMTVTYQRKK